MFWPIIISPGTPLDGLSEIGAGTSNHTHGSCGMLLFTRHKLWDEITYPFLNFIGATVEVNEWIIVISPHTLLGMWLLTHAGIKVKPC